MLVGQPGWEPEEREIDIPRSHAQAFLEASAEPNWNDFEVLRFYIGCSSVISYTITMDPEVEGPVKLKAEYVP